MPAFFALPAFTGPKGDECAWYLRLRAARSLAKTSLLAVRSGVDRRRLQSATNGESLMPISPAMKARCNEIVRRAGEFRRKSKAALAEIGSLDLDRGAQLFPQELAKSMLGAEQARLALVRALADFDSKCAAVQAAASKLAQ